MQIQLVRVGENYCNGNKNNNDKTEYLQFTIWQYNYENLLYKYLMQSFSFISFATFYKLILYKFEYNELK